MLICRIHSHGGIPPCVDDSHRSCNYLIMYVMVGIACHIIPRFPRLECVLTIYSTVVGRMLLILPADPQYLPYLYVL
jgi:hypothetical protein